MTHQDHKQGGCCGADKHHDHENSNPAKEKEGCCDSKDKKLETDKTEEKDGCCGSSKK